jgi:hypothetical protein
VLYSVFDDLDAVYYNGLWVDTGAKTTSTKFIVGSGNNYQNEEWTLGLYGDLDCDGELTINDFSVVVNKALNESYDENDITDVLADADNDKVIDGLDLMLYELARTGNYKF